MALPTMHLHMTHSQPQSFRKHRVSSVVPIAERLPRESLYPWRVSPHVMQKPRNFLTSFSSFLQFGSPHGISAQAQHVAAERSEVFVNIGYRLSAFGFLASDEPKIEGNFGFKDQWLALLWIKDNIAAFGGLQFFCSLDPLQT